MRRLMDFWREPGQTIVLTQEEVNEAQHYQDMFKEPGYELYVKQEYAERLKRAIVAQSLTYKARSYAQDGLLILNETIEQLAEAAAKAYAIHPLPIYIFYFAKVLHRAGQPEDAKLFFRRFQKELSEFDPDAL